MSIRTLGCDKVSSFEILSSSNIKNKKPQRFTVIQKYLVSFPGKWTFYCVSCFCCCSPTWAVKLCPAPLPWAESGVGGQVLLLLCHPMHSLGPTGIPLSPFALQVFLIQPLCPWLRESPQGPSFLSFSCSLCTPCSLKCLPSHFSLISWQYGHFPFSFLSDYSLLHP